MREFDVRLFPNDGNWPNVRGTKAAGEPRLLLAISVWTAVHDALKAARAPTRARASSRRSRCYGRFTRENFRDGNSDFSRPRQRWKSGRSVRGGHVRRWKVAICPRERGAKAIVTSAGLHSGTVVGGLVEAGAITEAQSLLREGRAGPVSVTWNLAARSGDDLPAVR